MQGKAQEDDAPARSSIFGRIRSLRNAWLAILIYGSLVMGFTVVSLFVSPLDSRTGLFRAVDTIPGHLALLTGGGIFLGALSTVIYRRFDLKLAITIPAFVIMTDLDHIPSALGIAQPIRPAHSFFFVAIVFVLILAATKDKSLAVAAISGFFAHIGVDTREFAFFSPVSFKYYYTNEYYATTFLSIALVMALLAGYLAKRQAALKPE